MAITMNSVYQNTGRFMGRAGGVARSYLGTSVHRSGMSWIKGELGIGASGFLAKWGGRAFLGASVISGYREGGVSGAIKGGITHLGTQYALGAGLRALSLGGMGLATIGAGVAGVGGLLLGFNALAGGPNPLEVLSRPYVREHMRKHTNVEMATPVVDNFGTAATMRQRSLAAIQNSRLNGRAALGSEASLRYKPYFR